MERARWEQVGQPLRNGKMYVREERRAERSRFRICVEGKGTIVVDEDKIFDLVEMLDAACDSLEDHGSLPSEVV